MAYLSPEWFGCSLGVLALTYEWHLHRKMKEIENSISTSHLPDWPEHGDYLISLVRGLTKDDELEIQVDTIGYLSFTHPDEFDSLFKELLNAANRGTKIKILTVSEETAFYANKIQFREGAIDDFTKLTSSKIEAYVKTHFELIQKTPFGLKYHSGYKPTAADLDDFIMATMFIEDEYCYRLTTQGICVRTTPNDSFIHGPLLWLRHKNSVLKEMILACTPFGGTPKGYAFMTRDTHLMEIYVNQFYRSFKEARPVFKFEHLFPKTFERFNNPI